MNPVVGVCDSYIGTECDNHPDRSSMVNLQQAEATSVCVLYSIAGTTTYTTVATSAVGNGKGSDKDEKGVGPGVPASISAIKLVQVPVWEIPVNVPPSTSIGGIVYLPVQYVDLLGVTLLPEVAEIIKELFCNFRKFADLVCDVVVADYLSTISESSELSATGRYICCKNYRELHLSALMYRCLCVYNLRYRPNFIRTLTITGIQVLSSSSDRRLVPLTGSRLLDFLSRLDCAISNIVNSVFNLKWDETAKRFFSEVKEGSLGYVGCKDLIAVLDACGIPGVALAELRKHERQNRGGTSGSSRGTVGGTSGVGTIDLARSLPSSAQSFQLPQSKPQSRPRFSSPLREYAGSPSELIRLSSAVGPDGDVPLSVQCVDLLGVTLLPDSAEIINKLFRDLRVFARNFTGKAVTVHSFTNLMNSKLLEIGRAIWCKNYKEVQKSNFMYKCLCAYYSRQYPDFIRALAGIKILSSPSERRLVPLTGVVLLDFLSRLECAIRETLLHMFELDWGEMVGDIFDKLEERSLDAVNLRDFVSVLDVAGIPSSVTSGSSGYLRYFVGVRDIRDKNSRISSKITSEDVVLGSSVVVALPKGDAGSSSSPATIESVSVSTVSDKPVAALTVSDEPAGVTATDTVSNAVALPKGAAKSSLTLAATESVAVSTASDEPAGVTATDTVSTAVALPKGAAGSSSSLAATESVAVSTASDEPVGVTATDTVSTAVALPKGASKSSLTLAATESVAVSIASDEPAGVTATDTVSTAVALPKGAAGSSSSLVVTEPVAALTVSDKPAGVTATDTVSTAVALPRGAAGSSLSLVATEPVAVSTVFDKPAGVTATDTVSTAVALPKGAAGSSSSLAATEYVSVSTVSDKPVVAVSTASDEPAGVSATDTVSAAVALPRGAAGSSSSLVVTEPVAALTVSGESSSIISGDVLVSTVVVASALEALEDESPSPSSLFPSELGLAADTSSASPPTREGRVRLTAVDTSSELWGLGGESPSVSPASSSSYMYSSPSESGWDADLSSFSPESPLLTREVGLVEEGIASTLGALGESTPAFSSEQLIVPITASSSISAPIGESFTAAKGSSYSYFYGPKKSFIMQLIKGTFEVPTSSADIGPSSSALVDDVQPVAAANDIAAEEDDVGAGLAALLNRGFLPSTLIASESNRSIRVDRSGVSSSHHSGAQRGGGHKRKRS